MANENHELRCPHVDFIGMLRHYSNEEPLTFFYRYVDNYKQEMGDRLVLLPLGWTDFQQFLYFKWAAPEPVYDGTYRIIFGRKHLPPVSKTVYQICYLDAGDKVKGNSSSFVFLKAVIPQLPVNMLDRVTSRSLPHTLQALQENLLALQASCSNHEKKIGELTVAISNYEKYFSVLYSAVMDIQSRMMTLRRQFMVHSGNRYIIEDFQSLPPLQSLSLNT